MRGRLCLGRLRRIHKLSVELDCAESQSQQHLRLAVAPNLLRLVLRTQPRSGLPAQFTDNLWMHWKVGGTENRFARRQALA